MRVSFAKVFFGGAVVLFGVIGAIGLWKQAPKAEPRPLVPIVQQVPIPPPKKSAAPPVAEPVAMQLVEEGLPDADRMEQLFALGPSKLPFVETVSYTSRVPWLKGRPAWIADYATHYATSRHFIARSLNRAADYLTQKISPGDRFNVFKRDAALCFHVLIDLSRCKMWLYALDGEDRYLLKTYKVGVGRLDSKKQSGCLTPVGTYELGEKVAIYKPGTMGFFQDQKAEMIRIFGTRWIPFAKEIAGCSEAAKGLGIHGAPWVPDPLTGQLVEDLTKIGKYESDGCIRLASCDIEEIFAVVITKPTQVELVKDFHEAHLPGKEVGAHESNLLRPKP